MHARSSQTQQHLGFGLGLRPEYYQHILDNKPAIDWFEIISENYMVEGGKPLFYLDQIRQDYPLVMHGVSMSIGGTDPLNMDYLKQLKQLKQRLEPQWLSDHLCWTGVNGQNLHDLMPLPYTQPTLNHVVERVQRVQDYLGCRILLENVSSYVSYRESEMPEWEFVSEVARQADCLLLLDINNVFVSSFNHCFDSHRYINALPIEKVKQIHLAGYTDYQDYLIDTHDQAVSTPVWELYEQGLKRFGPLPTMIERDDNFPDFSELEAELEQAKTIHHKLYPQLRSDAA